MSSTVGRNEKRDKRVHKKSVTRRYYSRSNIFERIHLTRLQVQRKNKA